MQERDEDRLSSSLWLVSCTADW